MNKIISPGTMAKEREIPITHVYACLSWLEKNGVLKSFYELRCPTCKKKHDTINVFCDLPIAFECVVCKSKLITLENIYLLYRNCQDGRKTINDLEVDYYEVEADRDHWKRIAGAEQETNKLLRAKVIEAQSRAEALERFIKPQCKYCVNDKNCTWLDAPLAEDCDWQFDQARFAEGETNEEKS